MKKLLFLGGMVALIGVGLYIRNGGAVTYSAPLIKTETVEKQVVVDNVTQRVAEAQDAQKTAIEAKAQAEYQAVYDAEMAKIKADVLKQVEDELAAQRKEIEKTITSY